MTEPITYRRIKAVIKAFGDNPSDDFKSVLKALKKNSELKSNFMTKNRETKKLQLISDNAILNWFYTARYWGLIDNEAGELSENGKEIYNGNFEAQFQFHLGKIVTEKWKADFNTILSKISTFNGTNNQWPTIRNWYEKVNEMKCSKIPQSRFKQLVFFMFGLGLVKRSPMTLYTHS